MISDMNVASFITKNIPKYGKQINMLHGFFLSFIWKICYTMKKEEIEESK